MLAVVEGLDAVEPHSLCSSPTVLKLPNRPKAIVNARVGGTDGYDAATLAMFQCNATLASLRTANTRTPALICSATYLAGNDCKPSMSNSVFT